MTTVSPPAPGQLGVAARPAEMLDYLGRLDAWLAKNRPQYHAALQPPAGDEELSGLEGLIAGRLPPELRQWLGWHNGQSDEIVGAFWEAFTLMSAELIAAAWQDRNATPEPGWDHRWIPLLDDYQGDLIVLDSTQLTARFPTPLWDRDVDKLLKAAPANAHFFFVSTKMDDGARDTQLRALKQRIDAANNAAAAARMHIVTKAASAIGGWVGAYLTNPGLGFGIDRFQRTALGGWASRPPGVAPASRR